MAMAGAAALATRIVPVLAVALAAGCGGTTPGAIAPSSRQPSTSLQPFGDAQSRWQLRVPALASQGNDVQFIDGLMLVAETDGTMFRVTAYHEDSGTTVWSRVFAQEPVTAGNTLLAASSSASGTALPAGRGNCAWNTISRINPASGGSMWAAAVPAVPGAGCPPPTASASYVVIGRWVLNAATGVTLKQLPAGTPAGSAEAAAFGDDILTEDGSTLHLDTLNNGDLQPKWHQDIAGYELGSVAYPQIMLIQGGATGTGNAPWRTEIVNPATGAITGSISAADPWLTPEGETGASASGHLFLLSSSGLKTGPAATGRVALIGGILWKSPSAPNDGTTRPMDLIAVDPYSFKTLGTLVIQSSQVTSSADGDEYLVSDGQYAAFISGTTIYVYKL